MFFKRNFNPFKRRSREASSSSSEEEEEEEEGIVVKQINQGSQTTYEFTSTFEVALGKTKFGLFNILLYMVYLPCELGYFLQLTGTSYISPILECEIGIEQFQIAALIGSGYLGAAFAAIIWGLIINTHRRKYYVIGFSLLHAFLKVTASFYQGFYMLFLIETLAGFAAGVAYFVFGYEMLEYSEKYRRRLFIVNLIVQCLTYISISGAALILFLSLDNRPLKIGANINFRESNIFLLVCCIPGVLTAIGRSFFSESPKYYMSVGKEAKALELIKYIYHVNTRKSKDRFGITSIVREARHSASRGRVVANTGAKRYFRAFCLYLKSLRTDHGVLAFLCFQETICMASLHGFRNWMTLIFTHINLHYEKNNHTYTRLCSLLNHHSELHHNETIICTKELDLGVAYFHTFLMMCILLITVGFYMISSYTGQRKVMVTLFTFLTTFIGIAMRFTQDARAFIVLVGVYFSILLVVQTAIFELISNLYALNNPKISVCLAMFCGRMGVVIGVFIFAASSYICHGPIIFVICCNTLLFVTSFFMPKEEAHAQRDIF